MKRLALSLCGVLAASFGCGPGGGATGLGVGLSNDSRDSRDSSEGRVVHVAVTPKGEVSRYYLRWATEGGQLVASPDALGAAGVELWQPRNEQLAFVELNGAVGGEDAVAALPGERARLGNVAVVAAPAGVSARAWLEGLDPDHKFYAEVIPDAAVEAAPTELDASSLFLPEPSRGKRSTSIDIDPVFLDTKLRQLSGAVPTTVGGQTVTISERRSDAKKALARAWLRQEYEALGFTVTEVPYARENEELAGGVNLVAEHPGTDPNRWLIVSAHYDSVGNAGADDDGAGTISALATARALAALPHAVGIRVLAFDQEELGLLGSVAYTRQLDEQGALGKVVGVLNLEMTGYDADGDGAFHAIDCNENTSATLTAAIKRVVAQDGIDLTHVAACTNRSDHAAFWRYNRPAIVVSQNFFGGDDNPCYHRACDTIDQVDLDYMTKVTTAVARAAADLAVAR
jgi:hypothetical protein